MRPLWLVPVLLAAAAHAGEVPSVDLKVLRKGAKAMGSVAGKAPSLPKGVTLKTSPDAAPPKVPETLCEDDEFKPDDGPCPELGLGEPLAQRAGLTRARIVKGSMDLLWGEFEKGDEVGVLLAPFAVPFELRQRMGISILYDAKSCPYRVTREHEDLHWADNRELYAQARSSVVSGLAALGIPTKAKPRMFPKSRRAEIDAYQDKLGAEIARVITSHRKSFKKLMLDAVDKRDTDEEYAKLYARCPAGDWVTSGL